MTGSTWDRLLDLVEHFAATPRLPLTPDVEATVGALCEAALADGTIDAELHLPDVTRWVMGLVVAHRAVRGAHPEVDPDDDLGMLRVVLTRWLHPTRPR